MCPYGAKFKNNWTVLGCSPYPHLKGEPGLCIALSQNKEHTLPVLKRVVDYGIEDEAVPNCGWSPEFKHVHRLQKGVPMAQAAKETQGRENRRWISSRGVSYTTNSLNGCPRQASNLFSKQTTPLSQEEFGGDLNTTSDIWGNTAVTS